MLFIPWKDNYSVGIEKIDLQHKKLIDIINQLYDIMSSRKENESIGTIIEELVDYAINHFKTEEELFVQHNYPKTEQHKIEHQKFIDKIKDFRRGLIEKKMFLSVEIMNFLRNWLIHHILNSDKEYIPYLTK